VLFRTGRPGTGHSGADRAGEPAAAGDSVPRGRARWFWAARRSTGAALVTALVIGVVATVGPATGAAGDIATGFVRAIRHLGSNSHNGQAFGGIPTVGALFTTSGGKLKQHFCTASVIDSPHGDLVITAAHCVTSTTGTVAFVPGYDSGTTPDQVWTVTKIYVDQAWKSSANPDDDVAILQVGQPGSSVPIEDVTGADKLATGAPATRQLVRVIGYPDSSNQPITCQNWIKEPMTDQLEFDCGSYTDGTSGGPFLADVDPTTGQGTVIGVIGGYEQGGDTPQVSYSAVLGANVAALFKTAVAGG
jgi:V8-like Glu-specific endopeptidase